MLDKDKIKRRLQEILSSSGSKSATPIEEFGEKAKFSISKKFINYFFWIIIGILIIFVLQEGANYIFDKKYCNFDLKEILTIFLTSLTPLVGFILGHYFKNKE